MKREEEKEGERLGEGGIGSIQLITRIPLGTREIHLADCYLFKKTPTL